MIIEQLTKHHAVEWTDEETVEKFLVKYRHPHNSSDEVEELEMMFVKETRVRVDLKSVDIIGGVLEQSVIWIEEVG